ncbi:NADH:ubiquinone/plastoquinone oxidoreductase, partial [Dimargaris cristalligena]
MLSLIIILIGLFTLTAINPVYSVIGLISLFGCSALYLINLSLYFIGLSYLIIYVGAIAILFLFVIMMINT